MENLKYLYTGFIFLLLAIAGCSDMNDLHEPYLENGERVYIGKIDTLMVHPGENRVKLRYIVSDPRVKSIEFSWTPQSDSLIKDIHKVSQDDTLDVIIGGESSSNTINEGNYTLKVVTYDDSGNSSIPYETSMSVYGERYQSTLINRVLNSTEYTSDSGTLSLFFSEPLNEQDIGLEILYTNNEGDPRKLVLQNSEITTPVNLSNVDVKEDITYRTMYVPDPMVIDTFVTDFSAPIRVTENINVALNKPVETSGTYNATYVGSNAVDGSFAESSRWLSARSGEHWIEIDLEEEYSINSINTWTGSGGFNSPTRNFFFQAEIDDEWVNILEITGNYDPEFSATFPEISTSKVRYLVPDYSGNMVRLFEIEVLSVIEY